MNHPDQPSRRPGQGALTGTAVALAVLLVAAVIAVPQWLTHRAAASAATTVVGPPVATTDPQGGTGCVSPAPWTPRQVRDSARQPAQPPTELNHGQPAAAALTALAGQVKPGPCDHRGGDFQYVQHRMWVLDTSANGGAVGTDAQVLQYENWSPPTGTDGAGRTITVTSRTPAADNAATDETFPPGTRAEQYPELSKDPAILAAQLNLTATADPTAVLTAIDDLFTQAVLPLPERAAAITILADTPGLKFHGYVDDRAGRPGIGISYTSPEHIGRQLLIFHPATGDLNAYEQAVLRDPGKLGTTQPTVTSYDLYLARTRTPRLDLR